jgi:hypothetical protein
MPAAHCPRPRLPAPGPAARPGPLLSGSPPPAPERPATSWARRRRRNARAPVPRAAIARPARERRFFTAKSGLRRSAPRLPRARPSSAARLWARPARVRSLRRLAPPSPRPLACSPAPPRLGPSLCSPSPAFPRLAPPQSLAPPTCLAPPPGSNSHPCGPLPASCRCCGRPVIHHIQQGHPEQFSQPLWACYLVHKTRWINDRTAVTTALTFIQLICRNDMQLLQTWTTCSCGPQLSFVSMRAFVCLRRLATLMVIDADRWHRVANPSRP